MKQLRQNGFVLILVITAMAAIGAEMFVLTGGANTMLFQSDTAYLEACEHNLVQSGLAWAEKNIKGRKQEIFDKTIALDITEMDVPQSTLMVTIGTPVRKKTWVQIRSSVRRYKHTLRHSGKYRIERKP